LQKQIEAAGKSAGKENTGLEPVGSDAEEQVSAKPAEPVATPAEKQDAAEPVELPKVQIDSLTFDTLFKYADHKTESGKPVNIGLDLNIDAENIATFVPQGTSGDWGTITIKGKGHNNPDAFIVDITADVAPLTDPASPSFKAKGSIAAFKPEELGEVQDEIGITGSSADLKLEIVVENGAFLKGSKLVATLHDARLTGKLKRKHKRVKLPPDVSITIPIKGTLAEPKISIVQAVTASVLRNLKNNPDYLLDNISVDGKSLRDRLKKALD
jgi:hypothetical protein